VAVELTQSGPGQRTEKYTVKFNPAYIGDYITANKSRMSTGAGFSFDKQAQIQMRIRAVLAGEAVTSLQYMWYYAFGNEVRGILTGFRVIGAAAVAEVAIVLYKYKTRGLSESVLNKVRSEVFSIPAPGSP